MQLGSTIIVAFVIAWVIQYAMTYFQMRRYNQRLNEMKKMGPTAVGMSGSVYKRRAYGILVFDDQERIIHAEQFSGWTVFASLKPVKELEGLTLTQVKDESMELPLSKKIRSAFINAVDQVEQARTKAAEAATPAQIDGPLDENSSGVNLEN
ncbi:MAG: hypothetical protein GYA52_10560 [Chloroflexi bacterium]|nr:hypothetical protein [Chloroflexota bacterium]